MDLSQKVQIKLAPLNGMTQTNIKRCKDRNRLKGGCTKLMYACQQGLTDTIVKEVRLQVKHQTCACQRVVTRRSEGHQVTNSILKRDKSNKNTLHYCTGQRSLLPAAIIAMTAPHLMEQADEDGFKPIHLAVIQGSLETVNLLLANKVDVNALDNEGHSVVHWATVCGEAQILRALLSSGADASIPDTNGATPLHYAAQMCGYDGKSDKASKKLSLDILNILLKNSKSSVEVEDKDGRQPVMWAASAGSEDAILALIKAGAYAESADKDGLTALHCAASRGHTRCIEILIKLCGAQTDLIDSNGCTALFYAVTLGHADATVKLLDLGADPNRQDRKGRSPGHCGCAKGQFETVKLLNSRGANLWLRNARGDLPVHEAAASGRIELVEWLLKQKLNHINSSSNDGRTILHIAAGNDNIDMCKMLIEMGADVNAVYRNAKNVVKTPLDCALQKGFRSTAKFIQTHEGLPANKLRLSGRKTTHNILPELDEVKPLKFTEIEVSYETKGRHRSKASDTDSDIEEKHRRKKHRRCSHKRRTSSCSEMFICHRVDEPCEINRSKSSTELHRRRKSKQYSISSSSSSDSESSQSDSSDDECCYHIKRKHLCYKKVKSKSRERDGSKKRKEEDSSKKGSESSECYKENGEKGKKEKKKKVEIASSAKKNDSSKTSSASKVKGDQKMTKTSLSSTSKKRPPSAKLTTVQKKLSRDKSQSIDKPAEINNEASIDISKKSTTSTTAEDVSEDDKMGKEITTQAEVHETLLQTDVDDGALTDATYTVDRQEKIELTAVESEVKKENLAVEGTSNAQTLLSDGSKKVSFKSEDGKVADVNIEASVEQPTEELKPSTPTVITATDKASSPVPPTIEDELPENIQRPKSQTPESVGSFTVLEDGDDANQKLKEFEEMTQDEAFVNVEDDESEQPYFDDSSSLEKLPRRAKQLNFSDDEGFKVLDESKDQDSGIEPSPRSQRSRIPGLRSSMPARRSFVVTDDRPQSTRVGGRKPGDKNAVNMTTVSQSIQKNMRRYYMERKIFQHLLELKSLQIRSCKTNEAVLVKRAVDDYHKSVNDLGFEVGGTLNKYPMREYTFKNFELFLYETLKSLQKPGTFNFQNISEVYREAERRLSPDYSRYEKALYCTTKTHRCLHATHAYTGIPCAAYIPMMNHHTMPKFGFGPYKTTAGVGTFYLPKILTNNRSKVSLEFSHANNRKYATSIPLPADKLDSNKRYLVTFTMKDQENEKQVEENTTATDESK
ncbi:CLUMA_CG020769, isoform A [Clunio marinus]|uniref:CLUMA_CG020769, isoform A n=1 Tax=Clunio marinus TaxID=568069 RepID=A0A1J1J5Z1_9DIPT|nr:CLUMA_CG020769, isoform A [Clunio marinus]